MDTLSTLFILDFGYDNQTGHMHIGPKFL